MTTHTGAAAAAAISSLWQEQQQQDVAASLPSTEAAELLDGKMAALGIKYPSVAAVAQPAGCGSLPGALGAAHCQLESKGSAPTVLGTVQLGLLLPEAQLVAEPMAELWPTRINGL